MGMKNGRPTKLTPELQEEICEKLQVGIYADSVCALVGIAEKTFYYWLERGEEEPESDYAKFSQAVKKATGIAELRGMQKVQEGEQGWQAHAWFLERRFPRKYGRRDPEYAELRELKEKMARWKELPDDELEKRVKQLTEKNDE